MAEVGEVIAGKYEVRGVLGEGGTGIVYDALRKDDGKPIALKVMHGTLAGDEQIRGRFQREAAILRRLEGPHICPILEFGEVENPDGKDGKTLLYIALPKLDGRSLEQVMEGEGLMRVDRALDIMLEVCAALRSAHSQGVIHRDLKPANVILGERDKVVVVDFGMSKIVTGTGTGTTALTVHNMLFGTPEYMSPEQARGDELDSRCDVYAAGVMLYELLTGDPPFTGSTPLAVLTMHLTGDIEPPSKRSLSGRVTPALEAVVMHALARDREQRYPSASALAAAILHALSAPDDVEALKPSVYANPLGNESFAATIPGSDIPPPITPPKVIVSDVPPKPTPRGASNPPASKDAGASGAGGVSGASGAAGASAPPASPRLPSLEPPSASPPTASTQQSPKHVSITPPRVPSKAPPPPDASARTWVILWVLAGLASIAAGIYLALR